jgi:hypothetical protein
LTSLGVTLVLNFTCFVVGNNNQFKVNVFFPHYKVPRNNAKRYVTMMHATDYETWADKVVLPALRRVADRAPGNLRLACLQTLSELPPSYRHAEARAMGSAGLRNFTGNKLIPEIVNLMILEMRRIVDGEPALARYRGYFFHILGINLKSVGQSIPGRANNNPMLHIFREYPIVAWHLANPQDIFLDVGFEVLTDPNRLPADERHATLIWDQEAMKRLCRPGWRAPKEDAYMHSHEVGGVRAQSRARVRGSGMVYFQCYQKDYKQTYVHGDRSIGTGFSASDAAGGTERYQTEMTRLRKAWGVEASHGVRAEWRCGAFAASVLLEQDPREWLHRIYEAGAIVRYNTLAFCLTPGFTSSRYSWPTRLATFRC